MLTLDEEKNLINQFNFSSSIISRGRRYYFGNNVPSHVKQSSRGGSQFSPNNHFLELIKLDNGEYTSRVLGSDLSTIYDVHIDAVNYMCTCTCPYSFSGNNCKHAYATLLAIRNHDYILGLNYEKENGNKLNDNDKKNISDSNIYGFKFKSVSEDEIIRSAIDADIPVFLHGKSSDGKSARVKQIDPDCTIIYLRNATPELLNGRSICIPGTEEIKDIKPTWLVKLEEKCANEPDKLHILFFDELSNALPSIQGMAFNIVLDKEVNGKWRLPENSRIVAAGNEVEDSLSANEIAEPLYNRFAYVYIETKLDNWLNWALDAKIHPAIYTFMIYTKGDYLRTKYTGEKPNADPRKWEMASKMLYKTNSPKMLKCLLGEEVTTEFIKFCKQGVIKIDDIFNKNYTDEDINKMTIGQKYLAVVGLTMIDDEDYEKVSDFLNKLGREFKTLFKSLWARDNEERLLLISLNDKVTKKESQIVLKK